MGADEKGLEVRVAGVLVRDGRVLLVRHERKGETYWVVPGGHVEVGEPLAEALKREFTEEIGLAVRVNDLVMANDFLKGERHGLNLYFSVTDARDETGDPATTADGGISEFGWFDAAEIRRLSIRPDIGPELARLASGGRPPEIYLGPK